MPNTNTKIQLKRSTKTVNTLEGTSETLQYGEPAFVEVTTKNNINKNKYLAIGNDNPNSELANATYFEGITDKTYLGKTVFANTQNIAVTQNGSLTSVGKLSPITIASGNLSPTSDDKYYLVSYKNNSSNSKNIYVHQIPNALYVTANGVLHGGAWNDYAEQRTCLAGKPGQVVCETGLGVLDVSQFKMQPLPYVVSDTYGIIVGETGDDTLPVAVAGRVLVYVDEPVSVGDVLCAGENGFAAKMTRQEIINYPDRMLGIVSEIPKYTMWNGKQVDGRVWITIK